MITKDNWTHCHFKTERLKTQISMGGELLNGKYRELFYVTTTDHEGIELFQKTFKELTLALEFINKKFSHLDFIDQTVKTGGCSSCEAH